MGDTDAIGAVPPGDAPRDPGTPREDLADLAATMQRRTDTLRGLAERAERHLDRLVDALPFAVAVVHGDHLVLANAAARALRPEGGPDPLTADPVAALAPDEEIVVATARGPMRVSCRPIVWDDKDCRVVVARPEEPRPAATAEAPAPARPERRQRVPAPSGAAAITWSPVVDLAGERVAGYAARAPDDEELIAALVVRAAGALADWTRVAPDVHGVAMISVPSVEALDGGLVALIDAVLRRSAAPPDALWVRIPSTTVPAGALETLAGLRRAGVRVALEGFARRGSPTHTLRSLPLDGVVLDASVVEGGDWHMARTALSVARHLGLLTMASGVGTGDAHARLRALGCTWAEGPLYGPGTDTHTAAARLGRQAGMAPA